MVKKLFLPSLVLISVLAFSCVPVHAEKPQVRTMIIQIDPNAPRTKGSPVVIESSLEIERTTLRDRGTALTMYLPPMERTFNSFSARTGETIFINDRFSNRKAPLHLEALIAHRGRHECPYGPYSRIWHAYGCTRAGRCGKGTFQGGV